MHRKIGAAIVALILFAGPSTVSFAQSTTGTGGGSSSPAREGIGTTSSTHNPHPSSPGSTGMENRKAGETGSDVSTHSPSKDR